MRRLIVAFAAGALILAALAIADPRSGQVRRLLLAPSQHPSELALVYRGNSDYLVHVDPRTLRPRGRGLDLPRCSSAAALLRTGLGSLSGARTGGSVSSEGRTCAFAGCFGQAPRET